MLFPLTKIKPLLFTLLGLSINYLAAAQLSEKDSLLMVLNKYKQRPGYEKDTLYINSLNDYAFRYNNINPDSTILISNKVIALSDAVGYERAKADAEKNIGLAYSVKGQYNEALKQLSIALTTAIKSNYSKGAGRIYHNIAIVYNNLGNYPEALENYFKALKMREEIKDTLGIASSVGGIGAIYFVQGKYEDALRNYQKALQLSQAINFTRGLESNFANIGEAYYRMGNFPLAVSYLLKALEVTNKTESRETKAFVYYILASINLKENKYAEAKANFIATQNLATLMGSPEYKCRAYLGLSEVNLIEKKYTEALDLVNKAFNVAHEIDYGELVRDAHELYSRIYEKLEQPRKALYHYKLFKQEADSINNQQTEQRAAVLAADYEYSKKEIQLKAEQEKKEIAFQKKTNQQWWIIFTVAAALVSSLVVGGLILRSRQKEKRSNLLLQQQKTEIETQKTKAEEALAELKSTQAQLIQSEKMASLGELTAGIAHEIQNPLNFINNFSDVSAELIDEMNTELEKGNRQQAIEIANDVKENLEKILHHGKRADAIVKSMLQHSRSSSGQKELTDINKLADEYLKLAYHGWRAKDKSFNAKFETLFDENIGKLNIVPQELGRVVLNLINNAFYAVNERQKAEHLKPGADKYEPTVLITTKKQHDKVVISIKDNGTGIPPKALEKIFQPFFTTKPTGQGTGLGLSLSYEIITKRHGGELKVETKEGEGTVFIIILPL